MLLPMLSGQGRAKHGEILAKLAEIVDAGAMKPLLDDTTFDLDRVGDAYDRLTSGKAIGKVVVEV
jgi:alcohol dehydrogenase